MNEELESSSSPREMLEQAARMLLKGRWWILTSTLLITALGVGYVVRLPNRYTSEAILIGLQPKIPQQYIDPQNAGAFSDMVSLVTQEILSSSRLMNIIDAFGLYSEGGQRAAPEQLLNRIRKDLIVEPLVDNPARTRDSVGFRISFTANSPRLAQAVTSRLTSFFIEENIRARDNQVSATNNFLSEQLANARKKLEDQEQRLRDFKAGNLGALPEQQQVNIGALTDLRIQLQNSTSSLSRAQMQRVTMESELNGILARLRSDRSALLARFTAKYPDVLKKDEEITRTESLLSRLKAGPVDGGRPQTWSVSDDPAIARLQSQIEAYLVDVDQLSKEQKRLQVAVAQFQGRLQATPMREQQMAVLLRDYDLYKQDYNELMNRQFRAQMNASAEEKQDGQYFRLIDPPTLPTLPSGPRRLKVSLGSAAAGFALGAGLSLLLGFLDTSFHTEKQLLRKYSLPLIVGVPTLQTPNETRIRNRRIVLEWAAGTLVVLAVCAIEIYAFRKS